MPGLVYYVKYDLMKVLCGLILWMSCVTQLNVAAVDPQVQVNVIASKKRYKPGIEPGFDTTGLEDFETPCTDFQSEECGQEFLKEYNRVLTRNEHFQRKAMFDFSMDLKNDSLQKQVVEIAFKAAGISHKARHIAEKFDCDKFSDVLVKRQFSEITVNIELEDTNKRKELFEIRASLESLFGSARACPKRGQCLKPGEHEVALLMRQEQDYDKLADMFDSWLDATGKPIEPSFSRYVALQNEAARLNGYKDAGYAEWLIDFKDLDFDSQVLHHYEQLKPLYLQLHAYVRSKLLKKYPGRFKPNDPIPAHMFGSTTVSQWQGLSDYLRPYSEVDLLDITSKLTNMSAKGMMRLAEDFFASIGLHQMTSDFWKKSVLEQLPNRVMQCHATAYDIGNAQDFRIRMCTKKSLQSFTTMHHEMGHIQYSMSYSHLPIMFRAGANKGFHEAIGDTIALSVNTPEHYHQIKFIDTIPQSEKYDINLLMHTALEMVAFLPFGLLCDKWRWGVFNGTIPKKKYNEEWWKMRVELQGVMPPNPRSKSDMDALSIYHITVGVSLMRYFMSFIMQFQFYEALCKASGYKGPLHRCDYYKSKEAGLKLRKMLELGSSRPWKDAMEVITGQRKVKTDSFLRYFQPLYKWLQKENKRLNNPIGWTTPTNIVQ